MKTVYIFIALLICCTVRAADEKKNDAPVNITADKIEYRKTTDKIENQKVNSCLILQDNVKVIWNDTTLTADKAIVYQSPNSEEYDKVVATGNIKLVSPERTVTAQKAVWEKASNELTLTGSPRIRQKDGTVASAAVFRYNTVTGKYSSEKKQGFGRSRIVIPESMLKDVDKATGNKKK